MKVQGLSVSCFYSRINLIYVCPKGGRFKRLIMLSFIAFCVIIGAYFIAPSHEIAQAQDALRNSANLFHGLL